MPRRVTGGVDNNSRPGINFATPTASTDAANKGYVDAAKMPLTAPSGQWHFGSHVFSTAAQAVTSGLLTLHPIDVGPGSFTPQQLGCNVSTTAQSGGTTTTSLGIYRDNGTGGYPDGAQLVGQVAVTLTATGIRSAAFTTVLTPGRYWAAFLYVASVAATTAATPYTLNNPIPGMWTTNGSNWTGARGLIKTGQTALPTTQAAMAGLTSTNSTQVVLCGLQAA